MYTLCFFFKSVYPESIQEGHICRLTNLTPCQARRFYMEVEKPDTTTILLFISYRRIFCFALLYLQGINLERNIILRSAKNILIEKIDGEIPAKIQMIRVFENI